MKTENKLLPFNLEKALNGAKVVTRDGREVTQLSLFELDRDRILMGALEGQLYSWNKSGEISNQPHARDLFLVPERLKGYVNIYEGGNIGFEHDTYTKALQSATGDSDYLFTLDLSLFDKQGNYLGEEKQ